MSYPEILVYIVMTATTLGIVSIIGSLIIGGIVWIFARK